MLHDILSILIIREELEDTKGVIRIRISMKDRQYNGKKDKRTNNDLQNITHKTKHRVARTPLITDSVFKCFGRVSYSSSTIPMW